MKKPLQTSIKSLAILGLLIMVISIFRHKSNKRNKVGTQFIENPFSLLTPAIGREDIGRLGSFLIIFQMQFTVVAQTLGRAF